jgi:MFS family permease
MDSEQTKINSNGHNGKTDPFSVLVDFSKKSMHKGLRSIFRDIEISRGDFFILVLITTGITSLAEINFYFMGDLIDRSTFLGGTGLMIALFIGSILASLVDRLEKKFPFLEAGFVISPCLTIIGIALEQTTYEIFPIIIFSLNIMIIIVLAILIVVYHIQITTILERGRIIAMVSTINALFAFVIFIFIVNGYFAIIPSLVSWGIAFYLYRNRTKEKTFAYFALLDPNRPRLAPNQKKNESKIPNLEDPPAVLNNKETPKERYSVFAADLIKKVRSSIKEKRSLRVYLKFLFANRQLFLFLIVIFAMAMIVGLLIPTNQLTNILILVPIFVAIMAFLIGLIFDFYGRKSTISLFILLVGILNFLNLFRAGQLNDSNISGLVSLLFALLLALPLINGDISREEFYGRTLVLFLIAALGGIIAGALIKEQLIFEMLSRIQIANPEIQSEISNIESVIIFNYNSGLLLYEHTFREEKDLATADLVSGGLIGLVSMLREITKGNQNLRVIDHGDKKLLFQWDRKEEVVFVLVIARELVVIRNKLAQFTIAFEEKYHKYLEHFAGVDDDVWITVNKLIPQFFSRKYMDWAVGDDIRFFEPEKN